MDYVIGIVIGIVMEYLFLKTIGAVGSRKDIADKAVHEAEDAATKVMGR